VTKPGYAAIDDVLVTQIAFSNLNSTEPNDKIHISNLLIGRHVKSLYSGALRRLHEEQAATRIPS